MSSILFATIAAGGGHVATATAMAGAVQRRYPGRFDTRVSDLMLELGLAEQDRRHKELWRWLLARPRLIRAGMRLIDTFPAVTVAYHRLSLDAFARLSADAFRDAAPDLIVANHGWLTVALTRAQRRYGLGVPVLTFATEPLDASAMWAEPRAERFVVPSADARRDLIRLGVPGDRIDVVGYPVGGEFLDAPDRATARRLLGLDDRFTCLVSLGGEGIGGELDYLETLLRRSCAVVVIAGRNQALKRHLAPLAERYPGLRLEGFSDRVATFVAASDVVIGKAGPASVFEVLAVGRPFIATSYAGLNEQKIVRFLADRSLGTLAERPEAIVAAVAAYQEQPETLEDQQRRAARIDLRGMTGALAEYIVGYARGERPPLASHPGIT